MRTILTLLVITVLAFAAAAPLTAQSDANPCPLHAQHMAAAAHDHGSAVDQRGDAVMGFGKHEFTGKGRGAISICAAGGQGVVAILESAGGSK